GFIGVVLGLGATWWTVEHGVRFGAAEAGPWRSFPRSAYADADPYTRAAIARSGEIPLASAEGLTFLATADETGARLDPACDYVIASPIPAARFWSLSTTTETGRLIANDTGRLAVTSAEVVRDARGRFEVIASSEARPGAWLPLAPGRPFLLALRLYDTPAAAASGSLTADQMPRLVRGACR
ncbi:MAG TPA: DUF1214 domain-containing protein, partial [Beijerinckiaceae bacterium]